MAKWKPETTLGGREPTKRTEILREADGLINGDRQAHYGPPAVNFQRIADRWGMTLGVKIEPWQVCVMMADLKLARLAQGPHRDSLVDGCGYLALAGELAGV